MKKLLRIFFLTPVFLSVFYLPSKATHIVGGDITVKSLGSNNFEITLTFYRDCNPNSAKFNDTVTLGVFDLVTNFAQQTPNLPLWSFTQLQLGDTCYSPPGLCVEEGIYKATINIPNNPNGYYISWHRCCRNAIIDNIFDPGFSGYVFYTEIPDPALQNSSPVFTAYPDAYMCWNSTNIDNFSASDADGDSLVYSFSVPLDCSTNGICPSNLPIPPPTPSPYTTIVWEAPYSATNIMGAAPMTVNAQTGIITTNSPNQGVFVFCVLVEEYRNGNKIGEIRRDVQYAVESCVLPSVSITGPNPLCLGNSTTLNAVGGQNYTWNTGETTLSIVVAPTASGTYTFSAVTTVNSNCHISGDTSITVLPLPVIAASENTTICPGSSTQLSATGAGTGTYLWSPSGFINNSSISSPVVNPSATTSYSVTGTDANGCKNQDVVFVNVGIEPQALFSSSNVVSCDGVYVQFTDSSIGATSWHWIFSDGTTGIQQNQGHLFSLDNSLYSVTLVVTNPPCQDSLVDTIPISTLFTMSPANVFTPNGDNINDCFLPAFIGSSADSLFQCIRIEIYDRWGVKIFESDGIKTCWDGTNRNNQQVVEGTYYYIAKFGEINLPGYVTLLRKKAN